MRYDAAWQQSDLSSRQLTAPFFVFKKGTNGLISGSGVGIWSADLAWSSQQPCQPCHTNEQNLDWPGVTSEQTTPLQQSEQHDNMEQASIAYNWKRFYKSD